ncbi:hypothetical protein KU75_20905 [Pectobacterium odoriferum]|uniref:Polyketide synthase n=1 Tax=Pectobacterium odoriferum TaxID=78398 RepID=A0ABR4VK73_9GAMM|nr:type I polyketide synthase [Pectobacterium odoriferum]KGA39757.1 hypothetical protein KU75_20905 [Pectobacterium odoriferum]POE03398.1 type I polyketide synthase [Pectobacterium odoriferum]TAJ04810.1 type I polyketide synthase [Pectobacterium versatile]
MNKEMISENVCVQHLTGLEIAIVGASCRFPQSDNLDSFWDNCLQGRDCISRFSDEVLAANGVPYEHYHSEYYVNAKGVIKNPLTFDAEFFNYNQREAEYLEPQIRKLHECGFEALGSAGIVPSVYEGAIGCYLAASAQLNWQMAAYDESDRDGASLFSAFNLVEKDFAATRLAYKLGLTGPAISVQTACSSSLTAIHLAARALLLGECQTALVAAAALGTPNQQGYLYQEGMITSPDGVCRPFDALANGTVGGEGVGAVVLQPLKVALAQGRPILALIKGSALNNDGERKVGYTAPSIDGQADVVRRALSMAKVEANTIGYIETHGTATALGDPVEIAALSQVFDDVRAQRVAIGSVKSIIGHLDSAAGMAGLIKAALMLKHKKLCANHYFHTPNPKLKLASSPFYLNTQSQDWQSETVRRAGVSAFGIGGTNAHVILEEYVAREHHEPVDAGITLLPLSAKSAWSLAEMEKRLVSWLADHPKQITDVSWTLQHGREHFSHRSVLVCNNDEPVSAAEFVRGDSQTARHVVFLFPGQGAQYQTMGRDLYLHEAVFREQVDRCLGLMNAADAERVKCYLSATDAAPLFSPVTIQLAIFTVEYAVTALLQAKGIEPDMLLGHSLGEYVAATVAGVFSLHDALFLVTQRAILMQTMSPGAMLSASLSEQQAAAFLQGSLEIAVVNGEEATVFAGSAEDISALEIRLQEQHIHVRRLKTTHSFHCAAIDEIQSEYTTALDAVTFNAPRVPLLSNLSGGWHDGSEIMQPAYWLAHQRHKVDFLACMRTLALQQDLVFVEVGPSNTLTSCVQKFFHASKGQPVTAVNMLRHPNQPDDDVGCFYRQLAKLWCSAGIGNWSQIGTVSGALIQLPVYAFAERAYTQLRDSMVNGGRTPRTSPARKDALLYRPVWYREPLRATAPAAPKNVLILVSKRAADAYQQHISHLAPTGKIILVDDKTSLAQQQLNGSYTVLLLPYADDFAGDPLPHYQQWLVCIRQLTTQAALSASRFVLLTPEIENVLGDEITHEGISLLKGLVQSLQYEHAEHACHTVDIAYEPLSQPQAARALWHQIVDSGLAPHQAFRHNQIWLPGFRPMHEKQAVSQDVGLIQGGLVVITGGTGGIGIQLAQCLARQYAARIVLLSRTPWPERELWGTIKASGDNAVTTRFINDVEAIEKNGGSVMVHCCDVTHRETLFQTLTAVENQNGAIDIVIHCAGSDEGALIAQPDEMAHYKIMSAKVTGARNLIDYFEGKSLSRLLLCSSLLSYSGAAGQSAYVAANAFLDALADRRDLPFAVSSLAWERWLETGMAMRSMKMDASTVGLTNQEGQAVFLHSLNLPPQRLLISAMDIEQRRQSEAGPTSLQGGDGLTKDITLRDVIIETLQHQLGLTQPDEHASFFALGATSLDVVQINEKLKQRLHCEFPISMMFTYSSIAKLHDALQRTLMPEPPLEADTPRTSVNQLAKQRMNRRIKK